MKKNLHIFFIASWLPSKHDAFEGDFILRHAQSIALYQKVSVVYAIETDVFQSNTSIEEKESYKNLDIYYIYLPKKYNSAIYKYKYYQSIKQLFDKINAENKIDIIHANVHWRAGVAAYYLFKKYKTPYVLSEHSAYFNAAYYKYESVNNYNLLKLIITQLVLKNASYVLPVSNYLAKHIQLFESKSKLVCVSNVVDCNHFFLSIIPNRATFIFLHASMLWPEKNIDLIIDAVSILHETNKNFELHLYAPLTESIKEDIEAYELEAVIKIKGLIAHDKMPEAINNAHATILYSDNETQGCIVLESLCCGKPVIVSNAAVFPEMINETNGIIDATIDSESLAICMQQMIDKYQSFDNEKIAKAAKKLYDMTSIGEQFNKVYETILVDKTLAKL